MFYIWNEKAWGECPCIVRHMIPRPVKLDQTYTSCTHTCSDRCYESLLLLDNAPLRERTRYTNRTLEPPNRPIIQENKQLKGRLYRPSHATGTHATGTLGSFTAQSHNSCCFLEKYKRQLKAIFMLYSCDYSVTPLQADDGPWKLVTASKSFTWKLQAFRKPRTGKHFSGTSY